MFKYCIIILSLNLIFKDFIFYGIVMIEFVILEEIFMVIFYVKELEIYDMDVEVDGNCDYVGF